ncbi:MAG: DUF4388 domain-containing protein [Trueperaceae bacterium]
MDNVLRERQLQHLQARWQQLRRPVETRPVETPEQTAASAKKRLLKEARPPELGAWTKATPARELQLQGFLGEGVLVNVMQYLAMNQDTGCLALRQPQGEQGQLYVENGEVVQVSLGSHRDVRAMAILLGWNEGSYTFRSGLRSVKTMRSSIERLLLEAILHFDVSKKHGHNSFYEDSILTARNLQKDQVVSMTLRAVQLLPHLDGLRTLGEIARDTKFDLKDVVAAAFELHQQGLTHNRALTINTTFMGSLKLLVTNIIGPVGDIVVDDLLYDLGASAQALPKRTLPDLLQAIEQQMLHERWRKRFRRGAEDLCRQYNLKT